VVSMQFSKNSWPARDLSKAEVTNVGLVWALEPGIENAARLLALTAAAAHTDQALSYEFPALIGSMRTMCQSPRIVETVLCHFGPDLCR
jgi:hypothetical protein